MLSDGQQSYLSGKIDTDVASGGDVNRMALARKGSHGPIDFSRCLHSISDGTKRRTNGTKGYWRKRVRKPHSGWPKDSEVYFYR